ncbi:MAG: hypothetical protein WCH57_07860 [Verrucomicrobiota bacterium]
MTRRDAPSTLSFGQALLFQRAAAGGGTPLHRNPARYRRFHPLLKQAALLGFALGFGGAVLFQSLRHSAASLLGQRSQPASSLSAAALPR